MDDGSGWLLSILINIAYLVVIVVAAVLSPVVIPESWSLRYYAIHGSYLFCSFWLTIISLIMVRVIPYEWCLRFARWSSLVWVELMGWDLRTWRRPEILLVAKNAVIVVNHQSFYDIFPFLPIWKYLYPHVIQFVGSELREYFLLGRGIRSFEIVRFVNRKDPREAMRTLISESDRHFKENVINKVMLFPEGTRNLRIRERGWNFTAFKSGAFRLAKELNVPVIPIVLSPYYFIDQQRHFFARGKTIGSVLEPIYPGDESVEEFKEKVKATMQEEFFRLQDELVGSEEKVVHFQNGKIKSDLD